MKKEKCMMKVKETMKEKWKKRIITKNMKNKISLNLYDIKQENENYP